ncbi:hypothetical protein C8J57DRAFT_1501531 [Mycena rebaudengoi]|nr:hypothetical protein C8J57DRAFT_1501531 [Mycena rebaudengoi]
MASPTEQLPPGWIAEWNEENQRYLFIETATNATQWELPTEGVAPPVEAPAPAPAHGGKRRQYAAGQTQVYYSDPNTLAEPVYYGGGREAVEQQPAYFQPEQGAGYGQQQKPQQPAFDAFAVDGLANQFSGMGLGGQKQFPLNTINMLTSPPEPCDLHAPPSGNTSPPGSCISPTPAAVADPSYQGMTLNATSSLLGKVKVPLALVITPHRTLEEGDEPIPLVTDVIARCRRCRMYINPYVQFIDGGNRWRGYTRWHTHTHVMRGQCEAHL